MSQNYPTKQLYTEKWESRVIVTEAQDALVHLLPLPQTV